MPVPYPPEFRARAIELARQGDKTVEQTARDLGISSSCLHRWLSQDERDSGTRADGLTSEEKRELVQLRRDKRRLETENEILRRAAAYFARENVLPK